MGSHPRARVRQGASSRTGAGRHGSVLFTLAKCAPFAIALGVLSVELSPAHELVTGPMLTTTAGARRADDGPAGHAVRGSPRRECERDLRDLQPLVGNPDPADHRQLPGDHLGVRGQCHAEQSGAHPQAERARAGPPDRGGGSGGRPAARPRAPGPGTGGQPVPRGRDGGADRRRSVRGRADALRRPPDRGGRPGEGAVGHPRGRGGIGRVPGGRPLRGRTAGGHEPLLGRAAAGGRRTGYLLPGRTSRSPHGGIHHRAHRPGAGRAGGAPGQPRPSARPGAAPGQGPGPDARLATAAARSRRPRQRSSGQARELPVPAR